MILCAFCTLDGDPEINAQGIRAPAATNLFRQDLLVHVPVTGFGRGAARRRGRRRQAALFFASLSLPC